MLLIALPHLNNNSAVRENAGVNSTCKTLRELQATLLLCARMYGMCLYVGSGTLRYPHEYYSLCPKNSSKMKTGKREKKDATRPGSRRQFCLKCTSSLHSADRLYNEEVWVQGMGRPLACTGGLGSQQMSCLSFKLSIVLGQKWIEY